MKIKNLFWGVLIGWAQFSFAVEEGLQSIVPTNAVGGRIVATLVSGSTYSLEAQAEEGYTFIRWLDGLTDNPRVETFLEEDARQHDFEFKALFALDRAVKTTQGVVTISTVSAADETFTLTVQPGSCATFKEWSSGEDEESISYAPSDGVVYPTYNEWNLLYENTPATYGYIEVIDDVCGFTLRAIANDGYHFAYWEDDASEGAVRQVDYTNDSEYAAHFTDANVWAGGTGYSTITEALDNGETTIYLLASIVDDVVITPAAPIQLSGNGHAITSLTIERGAQLTLNDGTLTVDELYVSATAGASSQLLGANKLLISPSGAAYFDYTLVPNGSADSRSWYGFAVPFEVNVANGIYRLGDMDPAVPEQDIRLNQFNGQSRAETGAGWSKNYLTTGSLLPGRFYMMTINGSTNTWRFKSATNVLPNISSITLEEYTSVGAQTLDEGWNGIANPMLCYVTANTSAAQNAYVYNNATGSYVAYPLADYGFVVGCPIFLQVGLSPEPIVFAAGDPGEGYRLAPSRNRDRELGYTITLSGSNYTDFLYLSASESASSEYERGKDLLKLHTSHVPQLWAIAYGEDLAAENAKLYGNSVEFEVGFNSPKAGLYTLSVNGSGESSVFLVKDGHLMWNLSESAYDLELAQGINTGYKLVIDGACPVSTDIQEQPNVVNENVRKFFFNNQLYILSNGSLYNAQGQNVK